MKVLVTGAAGAIGKNFCKYLCESGHDVVAVDIVQLKGVILADLRDEATVFALTKKYAPDLILHLAAIKDLSFCQENKEIAREINYGITEILTKVCLEFRIRLIFFSSDYVFGKHDQLWKENDLPCPMTQYGIDKLSSELLIQQKLSDYAIVRTAQIYGFVGDFVHLVYNTLVSHQNFIAFANLVNCPTWIHDLHLMINKIIHLGCNGIFHCVGLEAISRYEYACEIAKTFSLDTSCIRAVNLDFSKDIRPPSVRLCGKLTYEVLQVHPGKLKDNLSACSDLVR